MICQEILQNSQNSYNIKFTLNWHFYKPSSDFWTESQEFISNIILQAEIYPFTLTQVTQHSHSLGRVIFFCVTENIFHFCPKFESLLSLCSCVKLSAAPY